MSLAADANLAEGLCLHEELNNSNIIIIIIIIIISCIFFRILYRSVDIATGYSLDGLVSITVMVKRIFLNP
jgi:hypothetical protein